MSRGFVYILSNPSMPGIVKIGKTTRDVQARAGELFQTGVPTQFEVEHYVLSPDCNWLEAWVHSILPDLRVSGQREFFRMSVVDAIQILDSSLSEQVHEWVNDFPPDHSVIPADMCPDMDRINQLAKELDAGPIYVISYLSHLNGEDLLPAIGRWEAWVEAKREQRLSMGVTQ